MASIELSTRKEIVLTMSLDSLFILSALSDITKQQKARMMLGQLNEPAPPKINEIQKFLDEAVKTRIRDGGLHRSFTAFMALTEKSMFPRN